MKFVQPMKAESAEKKIFQLPSPIERVQAKWADRAGIELWLKRDDQIHPEISGNKWRKLKYHVERMRESGVERLLTFGGAFSNHLYAVAAAGQLLDFETVGIVRGDELNSRSNETLSHCADCGMRLKFVSREEYREKDTKAVKMELREEFGPCHIVPEGGAGFEGMNGCLEILSELPFKPDRLAVSAGTGCTASGLLAGARDMRVQVFPAHADLDQMKTDINNLLYRFFYDQEAASDQYRLADIQGGFHFGGFAKTPDKLIDFMRDFYSQTGIKTDPVYTGKMLYGVAELCERGYYSKGEKVIAIHTGGLQGISGWEQRYKEPLF